MNKLAFALIAALLAVDVAAQNPYISAKREAEEAARARANDPCRFTYYLTDTRGKALANAATNECRHNRSLVAAGRTSEQSLTAYQMWKDNQSMEIARRNQQRLPMTCRPDYLGGLHCQ